MSSLFVREAITTAPNNGTGSDDQCALREDTENSFIGNARGSEISVSQSAVTEPDHPVSVLQ